MIELLERLIRNRTPIVIFNEEEVSARAHESIKTLNLFRTVTAGLPISNQRLPRGTYVLLSAEKERHFRRFGHITDDSRVGVVGVRAYVMSFGGGETRSLRLTDPSIDIVVTERLTGCTFAAELNTATPLLMHINRLGEDGLANQFAINRKIVQHSEGQPERFFTIKKADYNCLGAAGQGPYTRVFAATVMGFRRRFAGRADRWDFFSQFTVFHAPQLTCVSKRGKQLENIERDGQLVPVVTEDPMDRYSDVSRGVYSRPMPMNFQANVTAGIYILVAVVFAAYLLKLLMEYELLSVPSLGFGKGG